MFRAALPVIPALFALGCSSSGEETKCAAQAQQAIVNGTAAEAYLGLGLEDTRAIVRIDDGSDATPSFCTGALIREEWLLTARHCLQMDRPAIELRLGDKSRLLQPLELVAHPELDLGLIRIDPGLASASAVRPFALEVTPPDERWLGERVELAGFGLDEGGALPADPRYAVETVSEIRDDAIVVNGLGRSGGCLGDSGGPLLVRNERGRPAVFGVLSTGSLSCLYRDTYVRLDRAAEWLEAIAGAESPDPAGCGVIGEAGICSFGSALSCRGGVLQATRCDAETVCGWDVARAGFGCVQAADDPCSGAGSAGTCKAGVVRECRDGVVSEQDCGPCDRCIYAPATGMPRCESG
jgi:hypothetical protein